MDKKEKTNGLAIASLICGLIGLFIFGLPLGIVAIVLGAVSFDSGLGKAGTFVGIFDVVMILLLLL